MPVDLNQLKQEFAERSHGGDFQFPQYNRLKLNYGPPSHPSTKKLKLFSWPPNGGVLAKRIKIHRGFGASGFGSVTCPKTKEESAFCPVCDILQKVQQSGNEIQRKAAEPFRATERYWILCLDLSELETNPTERKVYVWDAAPSNYMQLVTAMQEDWGDFTALPVCNPVVLTCTKTGFGTQGGKAIVGGAPNKIQINLDDWVQFLPDLNTIAEPYPVQVIEAMFRKKQTPLSDMLPAKQAKHAGHAATQSAPVASPVQAAPQVPAYVAPAPAPAFVAAFTEVATPPAPSAPVAQAVTEVLAAPSAPSPVSPIQAAPAVQPVSVAAPAVQPAAAQPLPAVISTAPKMRSLDDILKKR